MVLHQMQGEFGHDLEFDAADLFDGHYERVVQSAEHLGICPDSPVIKSAARKVRELSPSYQFRLRVGPAAFVSGKIDRYSLFILCDSEDEFPKPLRGRFVEFLRSLRLGEVHVSEPQKRV